MKKTVFINLHLLGQLCCFSQKYIFEPSVRNILINQLPCSSYLVVLHDIIKLVYVSLILFQQSVYFLCLHQVQGVGTIGLRYIQECAVSRKESSFTLQKEKLLLLGISSVAVTDGFVHVAQQSKEFNEGNTDNYYCLCSVHAAAAVLLSMTFWKCSRKQQALFLTLCRVTLLLA